MIAENIQDKLLQLSETKGFEYALLQRLKDYHKEPNYLIAPFVYILKELDTNFKISNNEGNLEIESNLFKVKIRPRIDGKNATPRLFFSEEKVSVASTNDNIDNLGDILAVKGVEVYIVGTDDLSNNVYAYKINRSDRYFEVSEGFKDEVMSKLSNLFNNDI